MWFFNAFHLAQSTCSTNLVSRIVWSQQQDPHVLCTPSVLMVIAILTFPMTVHLGTHTFYHRKLGLARRIPQFARWSDLFDLFLLPGRCSWRNAGLLRVHQIWSKWRSNYSRSPSTFTRPSDHSGITSGESKPCAYSCLPLLILYARQYTPLTRSRTVAVFQQCITALFMVKDQHPDSVKEAINTVLPVWLEAFKTILNVDPMQDIQSSGSWDNLVIRTQIFKARFAELIALRLN